jgi:hypothetical protein
MCGLFDDLCSKYNSLLDFDTTVIFSHSSFDVPVDWSNNFCGLFAIGQNNCTFRIYVIRLPNLRISKLFDIFFSYFHLQI